MWVFSICLVFAAVTHALIHPIEIKGKQFVDSITDEPFYIKGIDYQPGGSSDYMEDKDPLSDPNVCARDILLFQELGINTIRIYSLNPALNHDTCMTMLASAGIYLILDVNSPLQYQHLNRYEPWTTYNEFYLEHVFKVVAQFAEYNNTLGFFAGNEVVNDQKSAQNSPAYIKALVGDMKSYISKHCSRNIPISYAAADDLNYRVSLASFLECCDSSISALDNSVDFYGVNTYQWCGKQTMESSGYDKLVDAYKNYSKPVFFSEFGCNKVLPRQFDEAQALFSEEMFATFSGGLVYEFSQESNNYGLVDIDKDDNSVKLLGDFDQLKTHYKSIKFPTKQHLNKVIASDKILSKQSSNIDKLPCQQKYPNLKIDTKVAKGIATPLIKKGVVVKKGKYVDLSQEDLTTDCKIFTSSGEIWNTEDRSIDIVYDIDSISIEEQKSLNDRQRHKNSAAHLKLSRFMFGLLLLTSL